MNYAYETLTEALSDLEERGYTHDFNIHSEKECLICNNNTAELDAEEFEIDETYRFEGDTDPADEMILFAISSTKHNLKGTLVNAYGIYSDAEANNVISKLKNHL